MRIVWIGCLVLEMTGAVRAAGVTSLSGFDAPGSMVSKQ